jgi:hypothetical protein
MSAGFNGSPVVQCASGDLPFALAAEQNNGSHFKTARSHDTFEAGAGRDRIGRFEILMQALLH